MKRAENLSAPILSRIIQPFALSAALTWSGGVRAVCGWQVEVPSKAHACELPSLCHLYLSRTAVLHSRRRLEVHRLAAQSSSPHSQS